MLADVGAVAKDGILLRKLLLGRQVVPHVVQRYDVLGLARPPATRAGAGAGPRASAASAGAQGVVGCSTSSGTGDRAGPTG